MVATVAFSVEPSQSPSGCLTPSVSIPSATTQQRPLSSIPSSISTARRRSSERPAISSIRCSRVRETNSRETADLLVERARSSTLAADRLAGARVAARGDADQHPLQHHRGELVARGEVPIGAQLDLARAVGAAHARAADRHAPTTERDLAALVTVTHRRALAIVAALRADDLVDLGLHQLVQHPEPDPDAERQQPLLRRAGELAERLAHALGQLLQRSSAGMTGAAGTVLIAVGPPVLVGLGFAPVTVPTRTGRGGRTAVFKFYELRDNLQPEVGRADRDLRGQDDLVRVADSLRVVALHPAARRLDVARVGVGDVDLAGRLLGRLDRAWAGTRSGGRSSSPRAPGRPHRRRWRRTRFAALPPGAAWPP